MSTAGYIDLGLLIIVLGAISIAYFWFNKPV